MTSLLPKVGDLQVERLSKQELGPNRCRLAAFDPAYGPTRQPNSCSKLLGAEPAIDPQLAEPDMRRIVCLAPHSGARYWIGSNPASRRRSPDDPKGDR